MSTITNEQIDQVNRLMLQPPSRWPATLQATATDLCKEVQASYETLRAIVTAWVVDGRDRALTMEQVSALQPQVDLRHSMS